MIQGLLSVKKIVCVTVQAHVTGTRLQPGNYHPKSEAEIQPQVVLRRRHTVHRLRQQRREKGFMANTNGAKGAGNVGKVVQIIGPVVDVEFSDSNLPPIYQALRVTSEGFDVPRPIDVICEVQQHLGEGRVRTVSMLPTDGMIRGMRAV